MKVAVITFSDFNTNYGSMLQAFSLKNYLERCGHDVEFIRYREFNSPCNDLKFKGKLISQGKRLVLGAYALYRRKDIKKTKRNFDTFKVKYFNFTSLYVSNEQLKEKLPTYDYYICGSDQIWNFSCLGGMREPYFLDFAPEEKVKIAYAASLGDYCIEEAYKKRVSQMLNRLNYISVREKESVKSIQELTYKQVRSVVDPVFLTSSDEWEKVLPSIKHESEYAVCYFVRRSKFGKKIVKLLKEKYHIPILNLSDNMIYINGTTKKYISAGPLEFLSLIKNAKYAVGTSFHLAAFSILFKVPFLIAGLESNRNRIENILELVDLKDNFITEADDYIEKIDNIFNQKFNYVDLENQIEKSKEFLFEALNNNGK